MSSEANIHLLLTAISAGPDPVRLDYALYRRRFSVSRVPAISQIKDPEGNPMFVLVKKADAIKFLKEHHHFYTREEMEAELKDAASDFYRAVQRE